MKKMYESVTNTYFFNYNLYEKFINRQNNNLPYNYNFISSLICGYVSIFEEEIEKNRKVKFVLISRRNQNHEGTRYITREDRWWRSYFKLCRNWTNNIYYLLK